MNPFDDPKYRDFQGMRQFLAEIADALGKGEMDPREVAAFVKAVTSDDDENKFDVTGYYRAGLFAMGEDDLAEAITRVDLIWVGQNLAVGLAGHSHGSVDHDNLTMAQHLALLHALRGVLSGGGLTTRVEGDRLIMYPPQDLPDPWEQAITELRTELDSMDDPMSKWYKPKED